MLKHKDYQRFKVQVQSELTGSGKDPNFANKDEIDPPGTNCIIIFNESLSLTVPKYLSFVSKFVPFFILVNVAFKKF
jgi:hypothetical protein